MQNQGFGTFGPTPSFGQSSFASTGFGFNPTGFGTTSSTGFGSNPTGFGTTSSTGFGSNPTGFGTTPSTGFGGTGNTGFGTPSNTGFGATAPTGFNTAPTGFGTPSNTGFGATAPTGFNTAPTGFGTPSNTGFGATSTGFGTTPPTGFGATSNTGFGTPSSNTGFGTAPTGFGTTAPTGFGATSNTGFGTPSSNTGFGATATGFGTGMFGSSSTPSTTGFNTGFSQGAIGTFPPNPAFSKTQVEDGSALVVITGMPAYSNKSFEELRWEDYCKVKQGQAQFGTKATGSNLNSPAFSSSNNFGSSSGFGSTQFGGSNTFGSSSAFGTQPSTGFGTQPSTGFGTQPSTGFGTQPSTGFGIQPSTGFGTQPSTGFGTQSNTGFGGIQPSTGFGGIQPSTGFGGTQPSTGFGGTQTSTGFGTQPSTGFGTQPSTGFGGIQPSTGFGTQSNTGFGTQSNTGFGTQSNTGFGTQSNTGFGNTSTSFASSTNKPGTSSGTTQTGFASSTPSTGLFTQPSTGLFGGTSGTTQTGSFGTSSSTGLFGGTSGTTQTGFGSSTPSTGLFASVPSTTQTGSFGSSSSLFPSSGLFNTSQPQMGSTGLFNQPASFPTATTGSMFGSLASQTKSTPSNPFGAFPPITSPNPTVPPQGITSVAKSEIVVPKLSHYKLAPRSGVKIKPRGYSLAPKHLDEFPTTPLPSTTSPSSESSTPLNNLFISRPIKKLVIETTEEDEETTSSETPAPSVSKSGIPSSPSPFKNYPLSDSTQRIVPSSLISKLPSTPSSSASSTQPIKPTPQKANSIPHTPLFSSSNAFEPSRLPSVHPDQFCQPSILELTDMARKDPESLKHVENFVIGNNEFGFIKFLEPVDVRNLDLAKIVVFKLGEVIVYPEGSPSLGQGLNKPAEVTLYNIWPKESQRDEIGFQKFENRLRKFCEKQDSQFISYDHSSGTWVFRVRHFSRYGLFGDEEEEEENSPPAKRSKPPTDATPQSRFGIVEAEESDEELEDDQLSGKFEEDEYEVEEIETPLRLPVQLGLDPSKMRIMKFIRDYEEEREEEQKEIEEEEKEEQALIEIEEEQDFTPESIDEPSKPFSYIPTAVPIEILEQSKNVGDSSVFMMRKSRVGWGPKGMFVHSCFPVGKDKIDETKPFAIVQVEKIKVSNQEGALKRHCISMLNLHFDKSKEMQSDGSSPVPFRILDRDSYLKVLTERRDADEYWKLVFHLVNALWGVEFSGKKKFPSREESSYLEHVARYEAFNLWLKSAVDSITKSEVSASKDFMEQIFHYLCGKQLSQASRLAIQNKEFRLATLLAQGSSPELHSDLFYQLQVPEWQDPQFMTPAKKKIYYLLAGAREVCNNLDWKRALGIHLWYITNPRVNLSYVLKEFVQSFKLGFCNVPLPPYLELISKDSNSILSSFWQKENFDRIMRNEKKVNVAVENGTENLYVFFEQERLKKDNDSFVHVYDQLYEKSFLSRQTVQFDTLFHLLSLHVSNTYSLKKVFSPAGYSRFVLDYHLSWHLYSILSTFNYRLEKIDEGNLLMSYAFLLESLGEWKWAIYVILHVPPKYADHERAIKCILSRNSDFSENQEDYNYLETQLKIPRAWIKEICAWQAKYDGDEYQEVRNYIDAELYNDAHSALLPHLAPEYIISERSEQLYSLLSELEKSRATIPSWEIGGKIFLDFIELILNNDSTVLLDPVKSLSKQLNFYIQKREGLEKELRNTTYQSRQKSSELGAVSATEKICFAFMSNQIATKMIQIERTSKPLQGLAGQIYGLSNQFLNLYLPPDSRVSLLNQITQDFLFHLQHQDFNSSAKFKMEI